MPLLLGALLSGGCASFQGITQESGPPHPRGWAVYDHIVFAFNLNVERVDTGKSYAVGPGDSRYPGKRYGIEVEPNAGKNAIFRQDPLEARVYFVRTDGSRLKKIEGGVWSLHFVVEKDGTVQSIDQRWRIGSTGHGLVLGGR